MRSVAVYALLVPALALLPASLRAQDTASLQLRPGDQLLLQVKNEPNLSGRYVVSPEGRIMLPLIGLLDVSQRPFSEIESTIRTGFAQELADPELLVTPLQRVAVLGEVRLPGFQWIDGNGTLADAFVLSGGMLPTANRRSLVLVHAGKEERIQLRAGAPPPIPLHSGDQVLISRRSWLSENLPIFIGAAALVAAAAATSFIVR